MDRTKAKWIVAAVVALAGVAAQAIRATESPDRGPLDLATVEIALPDPAFRDEPLDNDFQDALRAREVIYRRYAAGTESPVWVFLAYFDSQREGSQVHSPRHCYPGSGWSIEREVDVRAPWRDGPMRGLVVSNGSVRRLICYWYQTPSAIIGDVFRLKLALTQRAVLRRSQDVVYGSVSTPVGDDIDAAFAHLAPYVQAAESQVNHLYREQDERRTDSH